MAGSSPSVWVLSSPGAGDNAQLRTLAGLITPEPVWQSGFDPLHRVVFDRLVGLSKGPSELKLRSPDGTRFAPPWPDLVLIAGGRHVINACRIRAASGERTRVVCLGRPWAPLGWFDLIVTTPQYRLPQAENLVTLDLPLNLPPKASDGALAHWQGEFQHLPRPLLGVLLGGDSGSYRFDKIAAERVARTVNELVGRTGGSAVVVGSPRTPVKALSGIERRIAVPNQVHGLRRQAPNPYASILQLADALLVTGDSASMLAEACTAGKPVGLVDLKERTRSRLNRKLRALTSGLAGTTEALTARGLWLPARDMPALHRRAAASGWLTDTDSLLQGPSQARTPEKPMKKIRERVLALLDR